MSRKLKTATQTGGGLVYITERSHMHMHANIKVVRGVQGVIDDTGNTITFSSD